MIHFCLKFDFYLSVSTGVWKGWVTSLPSSLTAQIGHLPNFEWEFVTPSVSFRFLPLGLPDPTQSGLPYGAPEGSESRRLATTSGPRSLAQFQAVKYNVRLLRISSRGAPARNWNPVSWKPHCESGREFSYSNLFIICFYLLLMKLKVWGISRGGGKEAMKSGIHVASFGIHLACGPHLAHSRRNLCRNQRQKYIEQSEWRKNPLS